MKMIEYLKKGNCLESPAFAYFTTATSDKVGL